MSKKLSQSELDKHIIESWIVHEHAEPDILIGRLYDKVKEDTGAPSDRQIAALERANMLRG